MKKKCFLSYFSNFSNQKGKREKANSLFFLSRVLVVSLFITTNIFSEVMGEELRTVNPGIRARNPSAVFVCAPGSSDPNCINVIGLPPGVEIPLREVELQGSVPNQNLPFSVRTPFYKPQGLESKLQEDVLEKQTGKVDSLTNETVKNLDRISQEQKIKGDIITNFQIVTDTEEPKVIEKIYFHITPEKKYYVQLSSVDVNRIVCPQNIKSVIFSEERGVVAEVVGNNLFIKYRITKVEDKYVFSETPVDMYIVCGNNVYSMVGVPTRIPGVTIYLIDPKENIKRSAKWQGMPFERKVTEMIRTVFRGEIPEGAVYKVKNKRYDINPYVEVVEKESFVLEVEGLEIRVFQITLKDNVRDSVEANGTRTNAPLRVKFKDDIILNKDIVERPLAYAVDSLILEKGKAITAVVIERYSRRKENFWR